MKCQKRDCKQSRKTPKSPKKRGFTLIELLAVIIILGVLMIIAIPSITKYINDSRENSYVKTAKSIITGARNLVNSGNFKVDDKNTTYYVPVSYIDTENPSKSPYGNFTEAYVGIITGNNEHSYFWISVDSEGIGVDKITPSEELDNDDIKENLNANDIRSTVETTAIGNRNKIMIFDVETKTWTEMENEPLELMSEEGDPIVCKRATTLHTAECTATSGGCFAGGFVAGDKGVIITYGKIPTGNLVVGDAYDCKVKKSEGYTERFYYVGSSGNNSILIYYKNMNNQQGYAYDSSNENWHGPRTAYQALPDIDDWNNPALIPPGTRTILASYESNATAGGTIEPFTYTGKAARFMTGNEALVGCGSSISGTGLDNCNYLLENVGRYETETGLYGYWLETPAADNQSAQNLVGSSRHISSIASKQSSSYGVRPLITIKTKSIS